MKTELDLIKTMDLSFLTEEEQLALQKVFKRDGDLKKLEERRIRKLKKSNFDANKLKIMTGEWFNEVKAKRYGNIFSGIDVIKNSFNRKKIPVVQDFEAKVSPNASLPLSHRPQHPDGSSNPEILHAEKRLENEAESIPQINMTISEPNLQAPPSRLEMKDEAEKWKGDVMQGNNKRSNLDHEGNSASGVTEGLPSNYESPDTTIDESKSATNPYSDFSISQPTHSAKDAHFWTAGEALILQSPQKSSADPDMQTNSSLSSSVQPPEGPGLAPSIDDFQHRPTAKDDSGIDYSDEEIKQDPKQSNDSMRGFSTSKEVHFNSKKNYPGANKEQQNPIPRNSTTLLSEILKSGNKPHKYDVDDAIKLNTEPLEKVIEEGVRNQSPDTGSVFTSRPSDSTSIEVGTKSNASTWRGHIRDHNADPNYEPDSSTGLRSNRSSQIQNPGNYDNDVPNLTLGKGESENSKRKGILKRSPSTSSNESENVSKLISIRSTEDKGIVPQPTEDYGGNSKMDAGNKQVRFKTKMVNKPLTNVDEGWKTDEAPHSLIEMDEDHTTPQQKEINDSHFSSLSPDGHEGKSVENPYLTNKRASERFSSPSWREPEAMGMSGQESNNDPSDIGVKVNTATSLPNPSGATVPVLTSNDPQSEEYDYFEDLTSESSFGSDILKQTDVQVGSNLISSKLSGSLQSLYSNAGDFGDVPVQGAAQFKLQYDEAKKEFKIHVMQCQGLAAANARKYTSDPYVKTYLLPDHSRPSKRKTSVKKSTLNPYYNEILKYKIQKQELQNRTLNVSVWHNDTLGHNVFLGETEVEMSNWDWQNNSLSWYNLHPKLSSSSEGNINHGEIHLALKYRPADSTDGKKYQTDEVHIWLKGATRLQAIKPGGVDSFVRCYILPDTSKKSRQKTRVVKKNVNPTYNHTMVYDGFRLDEIMEASAELSIWDHETFTNQFLGGVRLNLGTGNSYGQNVDWMDSSEEEAALWKDMISKPNEWVEASLPLRPTMTKRK